MPIRASLSGTSSGRGGDFVFHRIFGGSLFSGAVVLGSAPRLPRILAVESLPGLIGTVDCFVAVFAGTGSMLEWAVMEKFK